jgi:2-iminobutanoate/2-iminopropanoate deaminase
MAFALAWAANGSDCCAATRRWNGGEWTHREAGSGHARKSQEDRRCGRRHIDDITQVIVYLTRLEDKAAFDRVYAEFFGHRYPNRACIVVSALALANTHLESLHTRTSRRADSAVHQRVTGIKTVPSGLVSRWGSASLPVTGNGGRPRQRLGSNVSYFRRKAKHVNGLDPHKTLVSSLTLNRREVPIFLFCVVPALLIATDYGWPTHTMLRALSLTPT